MREDNRSLVLDISIARFAPMRRLLSGEDEQFLMRQGFRREARQLRAEHRRMFFRFVQMLGRDFKKVHESRKATMVDNWDFEALMRERWTAYYCLSALRIAGMMHWGHVPQAAEIAQTYAEQLQGFLNPAPQAAPATAHSF